ncbi:endolytic transglycosylase MltG [Sphingobacterium daejeonense]|uniref:endolytic transglycosylase MltG n=1 Tax=Sphingobacterium daejeonense TaxID=371142 RepID=UPI0010C41775|nr:endolytic transglycosylase MltG [Sphingobacterium daejeonense]VTQ03640.1 putative aminodeoxychorismate lyase [Sphingobacterium daejeonense]
MTQNTKKRRGLGVVLIIILLVALVAGWIGYQAFMGPSIATDEEYFYVKTDEPYESVISRIESEGIVKNPTYFNYVATAMDLESTGIKAGRYKIEQRSEQPQIYRNLRAGYQDAVKFRFQNIRLRQDFAGLLGRDFEADSLAFLNLLNDEKLAEKYGFNKENFFSMFIPNTYEIYWNTKPEEIIDRFSKEYEKFWTAERKAKADSLGMTTQEVSTLASIVKGEALHQDEMPKIAGLYLNRLKKGMLLQADPTVIFANNDFTIRRVLNRHLTIDNPYNTYRYKGLPPGPIMMPSIASIDAVLNYEHHPYIYMCAKDDFSGYHLYAQTVAEHLVNARKFQRALDARNIKK